MRMMNVMKLLKTSLLWLLLLVSISALAVTTYGVGSQVADEANTPTTSQATATQLNTQPITQASTSANNKHTQSGKTTKTAVPVIEQKKAFGDSEVSQEAFSQMARNMMPLTPAQIRTLHYLFSRSRQAVNAYPGTPPKPTSSSVVVDLSPGATPPVIRLRKGYVTSLVFLDSTGAPWTIKAFDIGDPKAFNIQWNKKSNTLLVQALDAYKAGNLAVILKGKNTPVMLTLIPGQHAVDYRVDLRIPGLGPNAKPLFAGMPGQANPSLVSFLDGVPPSGAKAVKVSGGPCEAWVYNGHLFLRTHLTVLSPGWLSTMSSPDGTNVYELNTTPIVLASQRGKIVHLKLPEL